MARRCSVCLHVDRTAIEREIIAGTPIRQIASTTGLREAALRRHTRTLLRKALAHALEKQERFEVNADRLIGWGQHLHARTLTLLERAETLDDLANARGLTAEARKNLELLGRFAGVTRRAEDCDRCSPSAHRARSARPALAESRSSASARGRWATAASSSMRFRAADRPPPPGPPSPRRPVPRRRARPRSATT